MFSGGRGKFSGEEGGPREGGQCHDRPPSTLPALPRGKESHHLLPVQGTVATEGGWISEQHLAGKNLSWRLCKAGTHHSCNVNKTRFSVSFAPCFWFSWWTLLQMIWTVSSFTLFCQCKHSYSPQSFSHPLCICNLLNHYVFFKEKADTFCSLQKSFSWDRQSQSF